MPLRRPDLRALTLVLLLAAGTAQAAEEAGARPEGEATHFEAALPRRCGVCHLDKAPAPAPGLIAFAPPVRTAAAGEGRMCYSCHNGLVLDDRRTQWTGRHHPSAGRVQCGSCHTPHVQAARVKPFMRYEAGSFGYCATCHPGRRAGEMGEHPPVVEKGRPQDCGSCHAIHQASGEGLIREASAEGLCKPCHGDNPSREGRGPGKASHPSGASKGPPCLTCHAVHKTAGGRGLLSRAAVEGRACRRCHERDFSAEGREENHPVAADRATCLSCHRMHNAAAPSGGRGGLLAVAWAETDSVCRRCHAAVATPEEGRNHPLGGSVTALESDTVKRLAAAGAFFAPGGKVACLTCHRAHGGVRGTPQLVIGKQALCFYCHPQQNSLDPERAAVGAHPVAVVPRRARIDESFLRAGGETGPGGELTCVTCHRVHGARPGTANMVLGREAYSCLLCHKNEISIASTPHGSARAPGFVSAGGIGMCAGCHGEHGWRLPVGSDPGDGTTAIERICGICHGSEQAGSFGGVVNHPLGVTPDPGAGHSGLPLFWQDGRRLRDGVITCATCHDVHRAGARRDFMRTPLKAGEKDPCLACHPQQASLLRTRHDLSGQGATSCSPCHPVHAVAAPPSWRVGRGGASRDAADLSAFCRDCHAPGKAAASSVVAEVAHPGPAPLGPKGVARTVGCGGCHDVHRWNPADPADRGGGAPGSGATDFLLRPASGSSDLCAGCHGGQATVAGTPHDLTGLARRGGLPPGIPDPAKAGICGVCHRVHGGDPVLLWALGPPAGAASAAGDARPDPCEQCHAKGKVAAASTVGDYSHPVRVSPGQDIGPDLPLYAATGRRQAAGRIACSTCHDPHHWAPPGGSGAQTPPATSFLRLGADGYSPLCFSCHAEDSMVVGTDHDLRVTAPKAVNLAGQTAETSGVCGACHAVHRSKGAFALWNRDLGDGPDAKSRACRSCHRPGDETGARVPPRAEAHLVSYPGRGLTSRIFTVTRSDPDGQRPIVSLYGESGSPAEQGYLSCASCHDVHRWESDVTRSGEGVPVEGDINNSFLRLRGTQADRTLCVECHRDEAAGKFRDYHFPEGK
jgi:predicted CXXCH cytochrome family protein